MASAMTPLTHSSWRPLCYYWPHKGFPIAPLPQSSSEGIPLKHGLLYPCDTPRQGSPLLVSTLWSTPTKDDHTAPYILGGNRVSTAASNVPAVILFGGGLTSWWLYKRVAG